MSNSKRSDCGRWYQLRSRDAIHGDVDTLQRRCDHHGCVHRTECAHARQVVAIDIHANDSADAGQRRGTCDATSAGVPSCLEDYVRTALCEKLGHAPASRAV
eukprot:5152909-Prymnesium_polylepis.1